VEPRSQSRASARPLGTVLLVAGVLGLGSGIFWFLLFDNRLESEIAAEWLEDRGKVAVIEGDHLLRFKPSGTQFVSVQEIPSLLSSLSRNSPSDLFEAMSRAGVQGLIFRDREDTVAGEQTTLEKRLLAYRRILGLQCAFLSPLATLYIRHPEEALPPIAKKAVAGVVRGILSGARPPRISSFPEPLRRFRESEVMVSLRQGERTRLWRSAKGNSIARALIAAASIARRRWIERESMMGDPLNDLLPKLDVDVFLLVDDGTVLVRDPGFIERVFTRDHYVAYQWRGSWRYQVPKPTGNINRRSAVEAYQRLFIKNNLPPGSLQRTDLRLYRVAASLLAHSPATVTEIRRTQRGTLSQSQVN
jgi:hypothetical protein